MRPLVLVVCSSLLSGCGGGGPTGASAPGAAAPSSSALAAPRVLDGVTGATVPAVVTPAQPGRNELATVRAAGYLVREQLYTGEPIRLWPARDERLVRQLVYLQAATATEIQLRRWETPGFVLGLPPEIADVAAARAPFERAAAEASRLTGLAIAVGSEGAVRVVLDPAAFADRPQSCAIARTWVRGAVITQAEIAYPGLATVLGQASGCDPVGVAAHELGHVLGLQHVEDPTALMNAVLMRTAYNTWEEESLQVIYRHRRAGNASPDRDAGLGAMDARERVERIVD